jgi:hypothetical protein
MFINSLYLNQISFEVNTCFKLKSNCNYESNCNFGDSDFFFQKNFSSISCAKTFFIMNKTNPTNLLRY